MRLNLRHRLEFTSALAVIILLFTVSAEATDLPVVLIANVATDAEGIARENRFVEELGLNLDGFELERVSPSATDFVDLSLNRQIESIRPSMVESNAVAAMWLSAVSSDMLLLQVVVLETGRALVRLFEREMVEGSEAELAETAGELLGTAYMFSSASRPREVEKVVEDTRDKASVKSARKNRWKFFASIQGRGGLVGGTGPAVDIGGILGSEVKATERLWFGFGLGSSYGPFGSYRDYNVTGWNLWLDCTGVYSFPLGKLLRIGPMFGLRGGQSSVSISREEFDSTDYTDWYVKGILGLDIRVLVSEKLSIRISSGLEASPMQLEVRSTSADEVIVSSAYLSWWSQVGVLLF